MGNSSSGNRTTSPRRARGGGVPLNCRNVVGVEVFDKSSLTKTDTVSIALKLLDRVALFANQGDTRSINMLESIGVASIENKIERIVIVHVDDEIAVGLPEAI